MKTNFRSIYCNSKKNIFNFFRGSSNKNNLNETEISGINNGNNRNINEIKKNFTLNKLIDMYKNNKNQKIDLNFISDEDPKSSDIFKNIARKANPIIEKESYSPNK